MVLKFDKNLRAMTLVEMIVAMAILVIVMAAIVPQLHCIQKSWAHAQSSSEILKKNTVHMDHLAGSLEQATQVTVVSAADVDNGFIEYLDNDGNTMRYDISPAGYVEFGPVGTLSQLAGPATKLKFACYDINSVATTDPNRIRVVAVDASIADAANPATTQDFTTQVLLRTNALGEQGAVGTQFTFDAADGKDPTVCAIDANHHLCAYESTSNNGYAIVLGTDVATATVTGLSSCEFDSSNGQTPALAKIDSAHYLCAYEGPNQDGWAVILQVNLSTWAINKGTAFEYDTSNGQQPALAQIDATHYLCTYNGASDNGYAVILTVNTGTGIITKGTAFKFDNYDCLNPAIAKIDSTRYLCVYKGRNGDGYAAILVPNTASGTITQAVSFEFESSTCDYPALAQIDSTRYLCAYTGSGNDGFAVILTVGLTPASIAKSASYEFDTKNGVRPSLMPIDSSRYLCVYQAYKSVGQAVIFSVNLAAQTISTESVFKFDKSYCIATSLSSIGNPWFLCVYEGSGNNGYAVMLNTDLYVLP